jgi:response regulator RpfG family c-di-GMP phosphodiesterase/tRNA A-37 threonylcarbamoyl transferase component Bud32
MKLSSAQIPLRSTGSDRANPLPPAGSALLASLVEGGLIDPRDRESFIANHIDRLRDFTTEEKIGHALIQGGLLNSYQLKRVLSGGLRRLVLGNYRVLAELGKGGMGVVYLAEHRLMKRRVAVKVLPIDDECPSAIRYRFLAEMRVLAELSHPNVVVALDASEISDEENSTVLLYLVTELIEGGDLEKHVVQKGLCSVTQACNWIRQAAAGLQAAHDRHLIHRDLKPSNLLLTSDGTVKLVDFGLVRQFSSRLTDPRALLGSLEFMPPEQSHDPSAVGKEADIYSLGATLFWLLTGEGPHPYRTSTAQAIRILQEEMPRRLRMMRADVPEGLDELVAHMLERNPARRPTSPLAVMNALQPFALQKSGVVVVPSRRLPSVAGPSADGIVSPRVLVVDDEARVRLLHRTLLEQIGCECTEATGGGDALKAAEKTSFDLVLLDLNLPDDHGYAVCRRLRERGSATLKVIVVSGTGDQNSLAESLRRGADDYVPKPYETRQLLAKVRHALERKAAEDRSVALNQQLAQLNHDLEKSLRAREVDLRAAHDALLFTIARIAESRDGETPAHLKRMQAYTRALAIEAAKSPPWQGLIDDRFLEQLERCVPLHDIGKIGLSDQILLKPASLTRGERETVETHPLIGDRLLEALAKEHGTTLDFLGMARKIIRSHHERWDGKGYPDRLAGEAIPAAARLVAVADVYDALRRMRLYKPAMSHASAIRLMIDRSQGQFDPTLIEALSRCDAEFERIYGEIAE